MNQIKMSILLSQKAVKEAEDRKNELVLEFSHEDIAPDEVEQYLSIPANGAVRWPATKWIPIPVRKNALPLLTAAVSTQNRTGTSSLYPVPQGMGEYKEIYNNRTSCERVNNWVLNDYHLHDMGIHTYPPLNSFVTTSGTLSP